MLSVRLRVWAMALCLLAVQLFTVIHAVEHELTRDLDHGSHVCSLCDAADHFGSGLIPGDLAIAATVYEVAPSVRLATSTASDNVRSYFARAPPPLVRHA